MSGQADIYAYLLIHAASFLHDGGRIAILTSNSWLDVAYGCELKRFLLRHFKIVAIVASWAEPWFEDAAINTVFTVIERCDDATARALNLTRFVKVKRPLGELLPQDLLLKEHERWLQVNALVNTVEQADASAVHWQVLADGESVNGMRTVEDSNFRIRLVKQSELVAEIQENGEQSKWLKYVRVPQIYFDLIKEADSKFVPLTAVADVRRGYTTGVNDFFFLDYIAPGKRKGTSRVRNGRGDEYEIEDACLQLVINSMKQTRGIQVDESQLTTRLFRPPVSMAPQDPKAELLKKHWMGAHTYVEYGEQQRTKEGVHWRDVPSVHGRKAWWLISEPEPAHYLINRFVDRRLFFPQIGKFLVGDTFFVARVLQSDDADLIIALQNSTLYFLGMEANGRVNLGDGLLTFYGPDIKATQLVAPAILSNGARKKILTAFDKLKKRTIKPIDQEVQQKDRQALDRAILEGIGLDPHEYLPALYQGLVEMVEERLALPKMRRKQKKQTARISLEQVETQLRKEILPNGPRSISSFLPAKAKLMTVPVTARPVTWQVFFQEYGLLDQDNNEVGKFTGQEAQARYAIHAASVNAYTLEIPQDEYIAVNVNQKYEAYLREVAVQLFRRALEATRDQKQSERVTRDILAAFDLSSLAIEAAIS